MLDRSPRLKKTVIIAGWVAAALIVTVAVSLTVILSRITPLMRERAEAMLSNRFSSNVELHDLSVSLRPAITVQGGGLVLRHHGRTDVPPLIEIHQFTAELGWFGLVGKPWHIRRVVLSGLVIRVPPKQQQPAVAPEPRPAKQREPRVGKKQRDIPVFVDELVSDGAELDLIPRDPGKPPHVFAIHKLTMHSVGLGHSSPFEASLTNAIPPGEIQTKGHFGPWHSDDPGQTPLDAAYVFENADLSVFHGIAGILSSQGKFGGVLGDIEVEGETDTPDFMVAVSGNRVRLKTDFQATVDGTNGDTLLHPVIAHFLSTTLICNGGVVKTATAKGKKVVLDVTTDNARVEDLLQLAVKGQHPPMTGAVKLTTRFELPPGHSDIAERLYLNGKFGIGGADFTDPAIRAKLESLSRRGQGKPEEENAGSSISQLKGSFVLKKGDITFRNLTFAVEGATIELAGTYGIETEQLDFHGKLHLEAKLSQITTGIKSFLLKPFDPFFRKGGETVLPIKITGTRDQPKFGPDFRHKEETGRVDGKSGRTHQ